MKVTPQRHQDSKTAAECKPAHGSSPITHHLSVIAHHSSLIAHRFLFAPRSAPLTLFLSSLFTLLTLSYASVPTIPIDSIQPGMKGYGLSVFSGYKVERFEAEVIDVMRDVSPGADMILCRLSGQGLEHSGIIAGMSGSPVYFNGKLAGAAAYAWGFSKDPICGVTPIRQMLSVFDIDTTGSSSGTPPAENERSLGPGGFKHLPVPLAISGFSDRFREVIEPELEPLGLMPVAAGGPASSEPIDPDTVLVPGGAIGVALTDGDVNLAGIGTLTWRDGNRILGFGHPMLQAGTVSLPLCAGKIHSIIPSLDVSFKLFSPGQLVGTLRQDRLPAIGGYLGPVPDMVPVEVKVNSPAAGKTWRFRSCRLTSLMPLLIGTGVVEALLATEGMLEPVTLNSKMTLRLADGRRASIRHRYSGDNVLVDMFRRMGQEVTLLFSPRWPAPELDSVRFEFDVTPGRSFYRIVSCRADRLVCRAGEEVELALSLRDAADKTSQRRVRVRLPKALPGGPLTLYVGSRDSLLYREAMRVSGKADPQTLDALFRLYSEAGREDELVVAGFVSAPAVIVAERELPQAPPSLRRAISSSAEADGIQTTYESRAFDQSLDLGAVISGTAELKLEVRR